MATGDSAVPRSRLRAAIRGFVHRRGGIRFVRRCRNFARQSSALSLFIVRLVCKPAKPGVVRCEATIGHIVVRASTRFLSPAAIRARAGLRIASGDAFARQSSALSLFIVRLVCKPAKPGVVRCEATTKTGAQEGTRTLTPYGTRPSNVCVYQFHHLSAESKEGRIRAFTGILSSPKIDERLKLSKRHPPNNFRNQTLAVRLSGWTREA